MSCVFRLSGKDLDVDALLLSIPFSTNSVYRKGEARFIRPNAKLNENSGFNVVVSGAEFDEFNCQIDDALLWIEKNRSLIEKAAAWQGVGDVSLDFGIYMRNVYAQSDYFPSALVKAAGAVGLGLELTQYPFSRRPGKCIKLRRRYLTKRSSAKSKN